MDACRECCVLSGRGLCDRLITCPGESYRLCCVVVCDLQTSWMRRPWPIGGCRAKNKQCSFTENSHQTCQFYCFPPLCISITNLTFSSTLESFLVFVTVAMLYYLLDSYSLLGKSQLHYNWRVCQSGRLFVQSIPCNECCRRMSFVGASTVTRACIFLPSVTVLLAVPRPRARARERERVSVCVCVCVCVCFFTVIQIWVLHRSAKYI